MFGQRGEEVPEVRWADSGVEDPDVERAIGASVMTAERNVMAHPTTT
ncbi:MAG: hypothetical protein R2715_19585 [Ilumatobacteraceae bacterium]